MNAAFVHSPLKLSASGGRYLNRTVKTYRRPPSAARASTMKQGSGDAMKADAAAEFPSWGSDVTLPEKGQMRIRQHVNPLARRWQQPVLLADDWYTQAFADAALPLVVDLGVGKGRFLLQLAQRDAHRNHLGLEIRAPLVMQANRVSLDAALPNVTYVACNANVSFANVMADVPPGALSEVYVQFCDPWFKKRHAKRRMVNDALVDNIVYALAASRTAARDENALRVVFIQSDVHEVAKEMRALFEAHAGLRRVGGAADGLAEDVDGWLVDNPMGLETEREITVRSNHGHVFRALFHLVPGYEGVCPRDQHDDAHVDDVDADKA